MMIPNSRATRLSWLKSLSRARPAPGYWILTATWRPSRQIARCTWPIDAAALGVSSNSAKLVPPGLAQVPGEDLMHRPRG